MIRFLISITILVLALLINGCKTNCDFGYEGKHCTTEIREKFLGGHWGSRNCGGPAVSDSITVSGPNSDVTKVIFRNIDGRGMNTQGAVQQDGSITIAMQNFGASTITGTAKVESGKIKIEYLLTDTTGTNSCSWLQN